MCETTRSATLMIPGTTNCPTGWTKEYSGYLMAEHNTHAKPGEYLCVDATTTPQGNLANHNGNLLYPVEAECGALPCLPYVQDREISCAVCTK